MNQIQASSVARVLLEGTVSGKEVLKRGSKAIDFPASPENMQKAQPPEGGGASQGQGCPEGGSCPPTPSGYAPDPGCPFLTPPTDECPSTFGAGA